MKEIPTDNLTDSILELSQNKTEYQIKGTEITLRKENDRYHQEINDKIKIEITKEQFEILSGNQIHMKEAEKSQEIERKFLIKNFPIDYKKNPAVEITQVYLSINPQEKVEVRIRKKKNPKGVEYVETVKMGDGKIREERETTINLTDRQYLEIVEVFKDKVVEKTRYKIPYKDFESGLELIIELDEYHGNLNGLITCETEFQSEKDSDNFIPPLWFSKEVTEDQGYKNQSLALRGIPRNYQSEFDIDKTKERSGIPEYELDKGVVKLVEQIRKKLKQQKGTIIAQIAGGSASGKTSQVAQKVKEAFGEDAMVFSMDDYYRGATFMETEKKEGRILNWDQPEALDLELFKQHLQQLKNGESIQKPIYNMKTGEPEETEEMQPRKIIIVEGLFALNDKIKDQGDIKAFVDIGTHGRIIRRILRDIKRTGQKPADILKYFSEVVEPMHQEHIDPTKKNADIIINNEYGAEIEAKISGLHEIQMKFKTEIDPELLRKNQAVELSSSNQKDIYYNPRDRDMTKTGEILRIREEGGHRILTYKGIKRPNTPYRERPKLEFEIEEKEIADKFVSIYGDKVKTVNKHRKLYQLDDVILALDTVTKTENNQTTKLGKFIEIRSDEVGEIKVDKEKIELVLKKLGLKIEEGIKKSYFEM